MASPAVVTCTGTSMAYWICDWMQVPFAVGAQIVTSGAIGTFSVDVTCDNISGVDVNAVGTTGNATAAANWSSITGGFISNFSGAILNFSTPVVAFRVNMTSAVATSVVRVTFVQGLRGITN